MPLAVPEPFKLPALVDLLIAVASAIADTASALVAVGERHSRKTGNVFCSSQRFFRWGVVDFLLEQIWDCKLQGQRVRAAKLPV